MAETTLQFGQISLGTRFGVNLGPLKLTPGGLTWRAANGGKAIEVKRDDVEGLYWTKGSRCCQLGVRVKDGPTKNFQGFREKDLESLKEYAKNSLDQDINDMPMSTTGRTWGHLAINNGYLCFMVDGKVSMEVPLKDVSTAQQAKDEVMMELHADDTAADERQDVLTELSFHVPATNEDFPPVNSDDTAAKAFLDQVLLHTDIGAASADEAVCVFGDVAVLNPRGRFEVEMHLSFLSLVGQTQDFKIRYTSIQRLFILPKTNTPHTLVVVSLDPPIRKGQTYYTHVLCQFPSDHEENIELDITPEQLAAKNEKCGGKLDSAMTGPICEVFAKALRGLSGSKISRPGSFRSATGDPAIRCSYKADDGHLYPLDRAFFYVHKPPMLLPFDEVESVEFARQGGGVVSSRTFDLVVRMKTGVEHQFRSINRTEWQMLFDFFAAKKLRVENLNSAAQGPGGPGRAVDIDDEIDPGIRRAEAEVDTEEDDDDFEGGDASSSEDIGSEDNSEDADASGDAEMVAEEGISVADVMKKGKDKGKDKEKRPRESGGTPSAKKAKSSAPGEPFPTAAAAGPSKTSGKAAAADAGGKEKKARRKKDPNAPKGPLSAFMYYSNESRAKVKEDNPGIAFGEVGKVLGEGWKAIAPEDKSKFERMAATDKERYAKEMSVYKAGAGGAATAEAAEDSDGAADE